MELKPLVVKIDGVETAIKSIKQLEAELAQLREQVGKVGESSNSIDKLVKFANFRKAIKTISSELVQLGAVAVASGKSTSDNIRDVGSSISSIASQFGIVGAAAGAAITLVTPLVASLFELSAAEKAVNAATDEAAKAIGAEQVILENSFDTLRSATANYSDRKDAIADLQKLLPDYFDDLSIEERDVTKLNEAYSVANALIRERAIRLAFSNQKQEQFAKLAKAQLEFQAAVDKAPIGAAGAKERNAANSIYIRDLNQVNETLALIDRAEENAIIAAKSSLSVQTQIAVDKAKQAKSDKIQAEDRKKATQTQSDATKKAYDERKAQEDEWQRQSDEAVAKQKADYEAELEAREQLDKDVAASVDASFNKIEESRIKDIADQRAYLTALSEQRLAQISAEDEALKKQLDDVIKERVASGEKQGQEELDLIQSITRQRIALAEKAYNEEQALLQKAFDQKVIDNTATKADVVKLETDKLALTNKFIKQTEALQDEAASKRETGRKKETKEVVSQVTTIINAGQELANTVNQLISQNQQNVIDGLQEQLDTVENRYSEVLSTISQLEDDLEGKRSGRRDAVLAAIEQQRELEKVLAAEKIALNERIEKENRKLREREKRAAIASAIVNGALAITNIFATVPKADFGVSTFILAGIAAATTAAQVALIASQKFAKGGFTGNGIGGVDETGYKAAGIVHEGEWVAPKWLVDSPKGAAVISQLEAARQKGSFATGGYTSPDFNGLSNSMQPSVNTAKLEQMFAQYAASNHALATRPAIVSVTEIQNTSNTVNQRRVRTTL